MSVENVTAAKPKVGGALHVAPVGTQLPTNATAALASAFASLGYISQDGFKNNDAKEYTEVVAWGGDVVYDGLTKHTDTFTVTMLEYLNPAVQKVVHGDANVTGTPDGTSGMAVKANADDAEEKSFVCETILRGGYLNRIVLPRAKVTAVGEVTRADNGSISYPVTIKAYPDSTGATHYEYTSQPPTTQGT